MEIVKLLVLDFYPYVTMFDDMSIYQYTKNTPAHITSTGFTTKLVIRVVKVIAIVPDSNDDDDIKAPRGS